MTIHAMPSKHEVELKFEVNTANDLIKAKRWCLDRFPSCSRHFNKNNGKGYFLNSAPPFLSSIPTSWYYDTEDDVIASRGYDYRVRITPYAPEHVELCVKSHPRIGSAYRHEEEVIINSPSPRIDLFHTPESKAAVQGINQKDLVRKCGTRVIRDVYRSQFMGDTVEFAFDTVYYLDRYGDVVQEGYEVEVEYKGNNPSTGETLLNVIKSKMSWKEKLSEEGLSKGIRARQLSERKGFNNGL